MPAKYRRKLRSYPESRERPAGAPDPHIYAHHVALGVKRREAAKLAGYSPSYPPGEIEKRNPQACASIPDIRAKLQEKSRLTLSDQARFYQTVRDKPTEETSDRLKAATRLDKILGYDAPVNAPVSQGAQLTQAINIINHYTVAMGLPVGELVQKLDATPAPDATPTPNTNATSDVKDFAEFDDVSPGADDATDDTDDNDDEIAGLW